MSAVNLNRRQGLPPVILAALVLLGLSFLARLFWPDLTAKLAFTYPNRGSWWGWLTYPLTDVSPLSLVFACLWLYLAGVTLESRWGSLKTGLFLCFSVPASSLPLLLGAVLLHRQVALFGMALPLACLTVAWCLCNNGGIALFSLILPIPVKVLLYLEFFLVYAYAALAYGPLVALFALAGPGLAYLYTDRFSPDSKWRQAVRRTRRRQPQGRAHLRSVKPKRQ